MHIFMSIPQIKKLRTRVKCQKTHSFKGEVRIRTQHAHHSVKQNIIQ